MSGLGWCAGVRAAGAYPGAALVATAIFSTSGPPARDKRDTVFVELRPYVDKLFNEDLNRLARRMRFLSRPSRLQNLPPNLPPQEGSSGVSRRSEMAPNTPMITGQRALLLES